MSSSATFRFGNSGSLFQANQSIQLGATGQATSNNTFGTNAIVVITCSNLSGGTTVSGAGATNWNHVLHEGSGPYLDVWVGWNVPSGFSSVTVAGWTSGNATWATMVFGSVLSSGSPIGISGGDVFASSTTSHATPAVTVNEGRMAIASVGVFGVGSYSQTTWNNSVGGSTNNITQGSGSSARTLDVDWFKVAGSTPGLQATYSWAFPSTAPPPLAIIWFENHGYSQVIGNTNMPFINSCWNDAVNGTKLATGSGVKNFPQMYAVSHPSLPNYLAFASGSTQGKVGTDAITAGEIASTCVWKQLSNNSVSWGVFEEGMPAVCSSAVTFNDTTVGGTDGQYALKHNPATPFNTIFGTSLCSAVTPLSSINYSSLPQVSFITPNLCDDMHGMASGNPFSNCVISTSALETRGDNWLSNIVPRLIGGGANVLFTWDEGSDNTNGGGRVASFITGPSITTSTTDSTTYSHYSILAGIENLYGMPLLGSASTATALSLPAGSSGGGTGGAGGSGIITLRSAQESFTSTTDNLTTAGSGTFLYGSWKIVGHGALGVTGAANMGIFLRASNSGVLSPSSTLTLPIATYTDDVVVICLSVPRTTTTVTASGGGGNWSNAIQASASAPQCVVVVGYGITPGTSSITLIVSGGGQGTYTCGVFAGIFTQSSPVLTAQAVSRGTTQTVTGTTTTINDAYNELLVAAASAFSTTATWNATTWDAGSVLTDKAIGHVTGTTSAPWIVGADYALPSATTGRNNATLGISGTAASGNSLQDWVIVVLGGGRWQFSGGSGLTTAGLYRVPNSVASLPFSGFGLLEPNQFIKNTQTNVFQVIGVSTHNYGYLRGLPAMGVVTDSHPPPPPQVWFIIGRGHLGLGGDRPVFRVKISFRGSSILTLPAHQIGTFHVAGQPVTNSAGSFTGSCRAIGSWNTASGPIPNYSAVPVTGGNTITTRAGGKMSNAIYAWPAQYPGDAGGLSSDQWYSLEFFENLIAGRATINTDSNGHPISPTNTCPAPSGKWSGHAAQKIYHSPDTATDNGPWTVNAFEKFFIGKGVPIISCLGPNVVKNASGNPTGTTNAYDNIVAFCKALISYYNSNSPSSEPVGNMIQVCFWQEVSSNDKFRNLTTSSGGTTAYGAFQAGVKYYAPAVHGVNSDGTTWSTTGLPLMIIWNYAGDLLGPAPYSNGSLIDWLGPTPNSSGGYVQDTGVLKYIDDLGLDYYAGAYPHSLASAQASPSIWEVCLNPQRYGDVAAATVKPFTHGEAGAQETNIVLGSTAPSGTSYPQGAWGTGALGYRNTIAQEYYHYIKGTLDTMAWTDANGTAHRGVPNHTWGTKKGAIRSYSEWTGRNPPTNTAEPWDYGLGCFYSGTSSYYLGTSQSTPSSLTFAIDSFHWKSLYGDGTVSSGPGVTNYSGGFQQIYTAIDGLTTSI